METTHDQVATGTNGSAANDRTPAPALAVGRSSRHGRGVFAARRFEPGELVEACPAMLMTAEDQAHLDETPLHGYLYECEGISAVAFGYGSLYNHAADPSARYELDEEEAFVCIVARRVIEVGEEITICYADDDELWFDPAP